MKKLLYILTIALIFLSCEKENDSCRCDAQFINIENGNTYVVSNQEIFCDTKQLVNGNVRNNSDVFVGCVEK